jgi:hypothetical protein
MDPMTEENEYKVYSTQENGSGAAAFVEGACVKAQVVFQATLARWERSKSAYRIYYFNRRRRRWRQAHQRR